MDIKRWIGIVAAIAHVSLGVSEDRAFTVRDSIEMTTFSEPSGRKQSATLQRSPDGNHFVVVTSRGLVKTNKVESTIWIFGNREIGNFVRKDGEPLPTPRMLVKMSALPVARAMTTYGPVISDVRWTSDSRSLYFLVQKLAGRHRLCKVSIDTGLVQMVTPLNQDVEGYSVFDDLLAYIATQPSRPDNEAGKDNTVNPDATAVTGLALPRILFGVAGWSVPKIQELWIRRNGRLRQVKPISSEWRQYEMDHVPEVLSISPDGRTVAQIRPVNAIPRSWEEYEPQKGFEFWRIRHDDPKVTSPDVVHRARRYVSVDLTSGNAQPLLDAPYGDVLAYTGGAKAIWAKNGTRILLTNTFLPLENVDAKERAKRAHLCAVASVEFPSRAVRCIAYGADLESPAAEGSTQLTIDSVSFGVSENEVVLLHQCSQAKTLQTEWYQDLQGVWRLTKTSSSPCGGDGSKKETSGRYGGIDVTVKQSLNEPPVLWATDMKTGRGREIWNPNPQLRRLKLGEAAVYHWKDRTGFEWTGGLVKPVNYMPGKRYPLVIQTHGFLESEFITDGQYPTAMAARPLASAGIVVLQVQTNISHTGELQEIKDNVEGYVSAIDQLTLDGLVDPKKVGIIGFSRTCWYVESALIEYPQRFAAASISDGIDHSYMQSMLFDLDQLSESQKIYGAKPFGDGLKTWLDMAPSFHLNQVQTPLFITAITPLGILEEWEIYSSLYQQSKPVDFIYIPQGQHVLQKPLDRLASQQGNVDWFRFWLQGFERANPEDRSQYGRWRNLQKMQRKAE